MRIARVALLLAAMLTVVLVVPEIRRSPETTFGGADFRMMALEGGVSIVLMLSAAAGVLPVPAAALAALGALWLVPEVAGDPGLPLSLRTLAGTAGPGVVVLVVAALIVPVDRKDKQRIGALLAGVTALGVATMAHLFLVDPFDDVGCWRTCEHNPWLLFHGPVWGRPVLMAGLVGITAAVVWGAAGELAAPSTRAAGGTLPVGRLVGWGVAATLATATLLPGPAGSSPTEAATVVFVAAQLATLGWLGAMWCGWWSRWRGEARLVRLAEEMQDVSSPGALPSALRTALRDPRLRLWYWAPGRQAFVDPWGVPVPLPEPTDDERATTVSRDGQLVALVVHSERIDGIRLDRALRPALRLALQNQQLRAAATAELSELATSRTRVVERRQAERSRLERNLHDGAQQHAFSLALLLGGVLARCADTDRAVVRRAQALTQELLDELRAVAHGIHPTVLTDAGLGGAVLDLAERSTTLPVTVVTVPEARCAATVETAAYLVVRELLADAVRRGARQATVNGSVDDGVLRASVEDDASDPAAPVPLDLADQVSALGGRLVTGGAGGASRVEVMIPCGS